MFEPSDKARCFALPPGCDFAKCLLDGIAARLNGQGPEALAKVEIFVNTRRTARRLQELYQAGPPGFLPQIRVITDLAHEPVLGADIPAAVPALQRLLELSQAVATLLDKAPELAPRSSVFDLAEQLAHLMDEMQGEGVEPSVFARLDVANHAAHWGQSLKVLNILGNYFGGTSEPDAEARQRLVVAHLSARWAEKPPSHPVIVAGSTGSRGATALFMEAVARLPQGAVVLPGFDFDLPHAVIAALDQPETAAEHPQAGLVKRVHAMGLEFDKIENWSGASPPHPLRNRLVSLALRPAPVTDQWLVEGPKLGDPLCATGAMTLLEAPTPRAEALAIALCLRRAAEDGRKATLISPDRQLTRQVTAALARWNILPDDSAGQPLPLSPTGIFLRLTSEVFGARLTGEALLILLKHPICHSAGEGRNRHLLRTRELELDLLRGGAPFVDFAAISAWADARTGDDGARDWAAWLRKCFDQTDSDSPLHLADHMRKHREIAQNLAQGVAPKDAESRLWQMPDGQEGARVFADLEACADAGGEMGPRDYAVLLRSILGRGEVRNPVTPHPDITIWGTLEARVQSADLVILGGLNDGIWPKLPEPDPWLSRAMRAEAGLLAPERRIGLSAHDFQQAIAAKEVVLSRSLRDADAPTVASRWLIRLINLLSGLGDGGQNAVTEMSARGQYWLDLATALERPRLVLEPQKRPSPRPPVALRPTKLSVTEIKTLIRDPYTIYARHILKLRPLEPIRREPDARLRGQAVHLVLEEFVKQTLDNLPDDAAAKLVQVASSVLQTEAPWPATRRLWLARLGRISEWFARGEHERRSKGAPIKLEIRGRAEMFDPPFILSAKADRIDRLFAGGLAIYDYKTGAVPSGPQVEHFDKQLPLEAAMAQRGAFENLDAEAVASVQYIGLGSDGKILSLKVDDDMIDAAWQGLGDLIRAYQSVGTGYTARSRLEKRTDKSDYDHLSRLGEWDDSDPPCAQEVS